MNESHLTPKQIQQLKLQELQLQTKKLSLIENLPHRYAFKWYSWAREFYESTNPTNLLCAANQISKDLAISTLIPTPDGFKKLLDIKVGDFVYGQDGKPTAVIDVPFLGSSEGYKITFNDGSSVIAGAKHDWICKGYKERFRKKYRHNRAKSKNRGEIFDNPDYGGWVVRDTESILRAGKYRPDANPINRFAIPVCAPIEKEAAELFDPYLLGMLIGNGCLGRSAKITFHQDDLDLINYCKANYGAKRCGKPIDFTLDRAVFVEICKLGLNTTSPYKFIPEKYMNGSVEQRWALLSGLMDTDGTCSKNGQNYNYSTTSERLAYDFLQLSRSLGCIAHLKKYASSYKKNGIKIKCLDHYVITIWSQSNPFRSKRKSLRWLPNVKYKHEKIIISIEPVGEIRSKCITVDNADGSFLCTDAYTVTHNSSTQIRKCIEWATNKSLWPKLWKSKPTQFWYLYPSKDVATAEFKTKWAKEFLPRNEMKSHHEFGWKEEIENKKIHLINFHSGVPVYFKTYAQDLQNLQSGTCYAIFADEELPTEIYPELRLRLAAVDGFFSMVFTATLNQEFWRRAIEGTGKEELLKEAHKQQVSMYDCMYYEDGSPGAYSEEKIDRIKAQCGSDTEVLRRVYGRFVTEVGRVFSAFEAEKHYVSDFELRPEHRIYAGVDIGSGGSAHPAAIVFVAVEPDFKRGTIFRGWRGDGTANTTVGDIMEKFRELRGGLNCLGQAYDYGSKDFGVIAQRIGENFVKAEKSHEIGEGLINTLFRNGMLSILDTEELRKLGGEFSGLMRLKHKTSQKDDFCFAAETAIQFTNGKRPISSAKIGEEVATRMGPKKIVAVTITKNKPIFEYELSDGSFLRCTENHRVFTKEKGFHSIGLLTHSDTLCTFKEWKANASPSKTSFTEDIQTQAELILETITSAAAAIKNWVIRVCTELYGNRLTEKSSRDSISIIKMEIPSTIELKISNAYLTKSISATTCGKLDKDRIGLGILRQYDRLQKRGMLRQKAVNGTRYTEDELLKIGSRLSDYANYAALPMSLSSLLTPASVPLNAKQRTEEGLGSITKVEVAKHVFKNSRSTNTRTRKIAPANAPLSVVGSRFLRTDDVFNITVADAHEYFANDVLVANCDAARYALTLIPWDFSSIKGGSDENKEKVIESRPLTEKEYQEWEMKYRRGLLDEPKDEGWAELEDTFDDANAGYGVEN